MTGRSWKNTPLNWLVHMYLSIWAPAHRSQKLLREQTGVSISSEIWSWYRSTTVDDVVWRLVVVVGGEFTSRDGYSKSFRSGWLLPDSTVQLGMLNSEALVLLTWFNNILYSTYFFAIQLVPQHHRHLVTSQFGATKIEAGWLVVVRLRCGLKKHRPTRPCFASYSTHCLIYIGVHIDWCCIWRMKVPTPLHLIRIDLHSTATSGQCDAGQELL